MSIKDYEAVYHLWISTPRIYLSYSGTYELEDEWQVAVKVDSER